MSRFDLFFVITDDKDDDKDFRIASHVVNLHRLRERAIKQYFTKEDVQTYIKICRKQKPMFSAAAAEILKTEYKAMRQADSVRGGKSAYRTTVRQLESLIRLSEAMARLHHDDQIRPVYVKEVCRLLRNSNIGIVRGDMELADEPDHNQEQINLELEDQKRLNAEQQTTTATGLAGVKKGTNDLFVSQSFY